MFLLNQFLSLDIAHAMNASNTVTIEISVTIPLSLAELKMLMFVPNREDSAGFREASLLLYTANSLLEDGGDLSWGRLRI